MQKQFFLNLLLLIIITLQLNTLVFAKSKIDIDYASLSLEDFIEKAYTPTYDCPIPELLPEIEGRLATPSLSVNESLALESMKTHALICAGHGEKAKPLLKDLLANPAAQRSAKYYVSAIYQLGFIYDTEEDNTRCKYYNLAKDASDGVYTDIQLSASLGYISECISNSMNERFFAIFELLDFITKFGDPAAIAHAHNRIGYLYATAGRTNLAAQQYMKGFNIAKDVYTDSNLLTLLSNAITNFISSGQLNEAQEALETYIEINQSVDSLITNLRQQLLLARFYVRSGDYKNLEIVIANWAELDAKTNNYLYNRLFAVYNAHLCLHNNDIKCISDFIATESKTVANYQAHVREDIAYLELLVNANIALQDVEGIRTSFLDYVEKVKLNQKARFRSANSFNLIELHNEISQLESKLDDQEKVSLKLILVFSIFLLLAFVVFVFLWNKRRLSSKIYDQQTGLLNDKEVYKRLSNLETPIGQYTNALAVFNFERTLSNSEFGQVELNNLILDIANTFKSVTRGNDIVGRLDGVKFVICIANIDETIAGTFFERLKTALIAKPFNDPKFNRETIESCFSIYCSEEKFNDAKEVVTNMLLSLELQNA